MGNLASVVTDALKCDSCTKRDGNCKKNCEKYIAYYEACEKASKILHNPSLGAPRGDACRECKKRKPLCHSTCPEYLLAKAYREGLKERIRKEKIAESLTHIVGVPGIPAGVKHPRRRTIRSIYVR